jgi:hypothetical protein
MHFQISMYDLCIGLFELQFHQVLFWNFCSVLEFLKSIYTGSGHNLDSTSDQFLLQFHRFVDAS